MASERAEQEAMASEAVAAGDVVGVEIYDQTYHLRGPDAAYIERLAATVDAKMRAVAAHGGTVDSLRVAVLAALNIADELESLRVRYEDLAGSLTQSQRNLRAVGSKAGSLGHLLDDALDEPAAEGSLGERRAG